MCFCFCLFLGKKYCTCIANNSTLIIVSIFVTHLSCLGSGPQRHPRPASPWSLCRIPGGSSWSSFSWDSQISVQQIVWSRTVCYTLTNKQKKTQKKNLKRERDTKRKGGIKVWRFFFFLAEVRGVHACLVETHRLGQGPIVLCTIHTRSTPYAGLGERGGGGGCLSSRLVVDKLSHVFAHVGTAVPGFDCIC